MSVCDVLQDNEDALTVTSYTLFSLAAAGKKSKKANVYSFLCHRLKVCLKIHIFFGPILAQL